MASNIDTAPPDYVGGLFQERDGILLWEEQAAVERLRALGAPVHGTTLRVVPWGTPAGHTWVFGRSPVVNVAQRRMLAGDILRYLRTGEWPCGPAAATVSYPTAPGEYDRATMLADKRFRLSASGDLVWAVTRGEHAAGTVPMGQPLALQRGDYIRTSGYAFLRADLLHYHQWGEWPLPAEEEHA